MGWEWRCFVPLPTAVELSDATTAGGTVETRTDHYLLVASTALGIKLRGGCGLEVKTLKQEKQRGAQKWKKEQVGEQDDPDEGALAQADSYFASGTAEDHLQGGAATVNPARAHRTSGCYWVSVQKQRQQGWLGLSGVCAEQTTIALQLHRSFRSGGDPVGEPLHYRTFAFERAAPTDLYGAAERWLGVRGDIDKSAWQDAVRDKLGTGAVIGGYPEMIYTAFGHILQQTEDREIASTEKGAAAEAAAGGSGGKE
jgi:hypothetical protein